MQRKIKYGILLAAFLLPIVTQAYRPTSRAIRESALEYEDVGPSYGKQLVSDWGLTGEYPSSWNPPYDNRDTSYDTTIIVEEYRLIPHDINTRRNYILELYVQGWDYGQELDLSSLDQFARQELPHRYQFFELMDTDDVPVLSTQAKAYRFTSLTGERYEIWFSAGRYIYVIGYRSLRDFYDPNFFFFEELRDSLTLEEVPAEETPEISEDTTISDESSLFSDVPASHPYADAIAWAKNTNVVGGYPDGSFQPDRTVNRAEFLKMSLEASGDSLMAIAALFPDVDLGAWYAPYVGHAVRAGIVKGYPDGYFRPEQTVNTAEALKMAYEAFDVPIAPGNPWYEPYTTNAGLHGIVYGTTINPNAPMKRKDVVWVLMKLSNTSL